MDFRSKKNESLNCFITSSIEQLLNIYSTKIDGGRTIMMGGLQQFLNKNRDDVDDDKDDYDQPRKGYGSPTTTFHDLPIPIQLYIFSLLDAKSVCLISGCCRNFYRLCNDEILWKNMLLKDMESWQTIQQSTHPDIYSNKEENEESGNLERNETLTAKEM